MYSLPIIAKLVIENPDIVQTLCAVVATIIAIIQLHDNHRTH